MTKRGKLQMQHIKHSFRYHILDLRNASKTQFHSETRLKKGPYPKDVCIWDDLIVFAVDIKYYERVPLTICRWNGTTNESILLKEYTFHQLF